MSLPNASADPTDAAEAARILRKKSVLLPSDFAKLDREAKKRAFTVTDQVSFDAVRDMRDALAKAKADGIPYAEFVKTVGPKLHAQWGIDSPQLKTVFVNNVQQAANQAIVARLNRQRGKYPYWTLVVISDEVTSATCGYFITYPVVLPAGHPWWAKNAPMRHHRCRSTLRGVTAAEAKKIGITKEPPEWPADEGWGGSAPMGEYKANMSDAHLLKVVAKTPEANVDDPFGEYAWPSKREGYDHIDEVDTASERLTYIHLQNHFKTTNRTGLPQETADLLHVLAVAGKYKKVLHAPPQTKLYRGIKVVTADELAHILGCSVDEIVDEGSVEYGRAVPLHNGASTSWSPIRKVTEEFSFKGARGFAVTAIAYTTDEHNAGRFLTGPGGLYNVNGLSRYHLERESVGLEPVRVATLEWERLRPNVKASIHQENAIDRRLLTHAMADGPSKYAHIDFSIPKGVRDEAQTGLDWRKEFKRGGTSVGVATARTLVSAKRVSPAKARHIAMYFPRHEVDKKGTGYSPGEDGFPSNGRIAWAIWGGDAGRAWSNKLVAQMDSADRKTMTMKDKRIKADIGQSDVHIDGPLKVRKRPNKLAGKYPAKMRAKLTKGLPTARKFKFAFTRGGTRIEVRHMSDRSVFCGAVELDTALLDDAGPVEAGPPKLVWNQLNKLGVFRGHPSGPFEITQQINTEIERNFRATANQKIPIDFEHASEQDPTAGTIPTEGAPAQAWIHDVQNRGPSGLWGLVEFLEPARTYVKQGKYKYFSPAIRFGAKDRVTGQPIGARMTSGAFTNNPFLDGLMPLAASDRGVGTPVDNSTETIQMKLGEYEFDAADVMPKLRMGIFGMGTHQADMANAAECYDALCRLEAAYADCVDEAPGAEPMRVQAALKRLRESMNLGMGMTVPEMIALVKQIVEHMIGEHVDTMHPDEETPASSRDMRNRNMADQETTVKLRDAENKVVTLSEKLTLAEAKAMQAETKVAGLELQLADRNGKLATMDAELKTLRDNEAQRAAADEGAAVELAFATYKDTHKLTDAHKKQMLITLRNDPKLFSEIYPAVAPDQRYLQRNLSARVNTTQFNGNTQTQNVSLSNNGQGVQGKNFVQAHLELTNRLMSDKKMPLELATVEARRQLMEPAPVTT